MLYYACSAVWTAGWALYKFPLLLFLLVSRVGVIIADSGVCCCLCDVFWALINSRVRYQLLRLYESITQPWLGIVAIFAVTCFTSAPGNHAALIYRSLTSKTDRISTRIATGKPVLSTKTFPRFFQHFYSLAHFISAPYLQVGERKQLCDPPPPPPFPHSPPYLPWQQVNTWVAHSTSLN